MNFDLSRVDQGAFFLETAHVCLMREIGCLAHKSAATRYLAIPAAAASLALSLATVVASVGESIIKGLANILGAPFSKQCDFWRGVKQIFMHAPYKAIVNSTLTVGLPIFVLVVTVVHPKFLMALTVESES